MADPTDPADIFAGLALDYLDGKGGRSTLEAAVSVWHDARWPDKSDDIWPAAKLAEEAGEVNGAVIKLAEGRKTEADLMDEMGDVLVVLSVLAGRHDWTLNELRARRLREVLRRG